MKIIDLSVPLYTGMPVFPGDPEVRVAVVQTYETHAWELRQLILGSHTGTHVDAFSHMHAGLETLDEIPLERFFGRARVVDPRQPDWPRDRGLLFIDEVGIEAAGKIIGLNPGFAGGNLTEELERALLGERIITYTDLIHLDRLPKETDFMFFGVPLKIKGGDGSPVRAFAILEDESSGISLKETP
ncbi:cyclase family protein [Paenibacillus validus]|uniref:cyclase family protein n=1 Tax=Paenibacillus validus TaxID=44253 RepID=UPI000FD86784|nr:cyclase family protein [Paenibacillus validus]MED4601344.1 cyclase family protein [Paenibacillus validus]MED4608141.1 cyclase family protein [Paenibacillus validus]